jgi:UvrD-like helicase family protein
VLWQTVADRPASREYSVQSASEDSKAAVQLSAKQSAVVNHRGGDLQVIACAGSGKTESVSRRIAAVIAEGAEPTSIVVFTFTERAASELKERVVRGRGKNGRGLPRPVGVDVRRHDTRAGLLSREYQNLGLARLGVRHWSPNRDLMRTVNVLSNELIAPESREGVIFAPRPTDHTVGQAVRAGPRFGEHSGVTASPHADELCRR